MKSTEKYKYCWLKTKRKQFEEVSQYRTDLLIPSTLPKRIRQVCSELKETELKFSRKSSKVFACCVIWKASWERDVSVWVNVFIIWFVRFSTVAFYSRFIKYMCRVIFFDDFLPRMKIFIICNFVHAYVVRKVTVLFTFLAYNRQDESFFRNSRDKSS